MTEPEDKSSLPPSKSQRKRDMTSLQKMGETLVKLSPGDLAKIPLDERLGDAVAAARAITNHEGKRRQLQYIGRLMRNTDTAPIQEALDKVQGRHSHNNAVFHQLERWRDKLIAEGDSALQEFVNLHPNADHHHLRQLIRNAQKDNATEKNSGASTELFRCLREIKGI